MLRAVEHQARRNEKRNATQCNDWPMPTIHGREFLSQRTRALRVRLRIGIPLAWDS
jgi:hypothetical protein